MKISAEDYELSLDMLFEAAAYGRAECLTTFKDGVVKSQMVQGPLSNPQQGFIEIGSRLFGDKK